MYDAPVRPTRMACVRLVGRAVLAASVIGVAAPQPAHADDRLERALAEQLCNAQDPRCDWLKTLSSLERATVLRAIAKRGYEIEPAPWGKVIGKVHVYNEDVFAEKSRLLRFFNRFHVTTKEYAILDEIVIGAGEVWDQERVDETARRLRDPLWTSVITVLPVKSADPAKVDMFVVTRDVWSLRLNTKYTFQESKLTDLQLALSENNFLGTRTVLALGVDMDQGAIAVGPLFIDKNLFGEHVELRARLDTIINREALFPKRFGSFSGGEVNAEGSQSAVAVSKPLWSLASQWGAGLAFSHRYAIDRQFFSTDLRPIRCPEGGPCEYRFDPATTPPDELLPWVYGMRRWSLGANAVRRLGGTRLKHQVAIGHSLNSVRPYVLDDFPGTVAQREPFIDAVLPRSEFSSVLTLSYGFFTPRFRTFRNVVSYELAEDVRFGPDFDVSYGLALEALGSDANFQRGGASLGWTFPWCRDGFVRPSIAANTRYQRNVSDTSNFIDNTASLGVRVVTPTYWIARIVAQASAATRWNDTQNASFAVGSDDGLRGYSINEFRGQRLLRANLEVRSIPTPFWVLRVGGVLFYDVAGAGDTFTRRCDIAGDPTTCSSVPLHHDIGFGLRALIPQSNRELFRFDLAFPLSDGVRTQAGSPKFIASFEQAF